MPKQHMRQPFSSQSTPKKLSALNLSRTKATGANVDGLVRAVDNCLYAADVCLPGSVGLAVRVGNVVSKDNALAADFTLCHFKFPPEYNYRSLSIRYELMKKNDHKIHDLINRLCYYITVRGKMQ
jgi:hypothetical protein